MATILNMLAKSKELFGALVEIVRNVISQTGMTLTGGCKVSLNRADSSQDITLTVDDMKKLLELDNSPPGIIRWEAEEKLVSEILSRDSVKEYEQVSGRKLVRQNALDFYSKK